MTENELRDALDTELASLDTRYADNEDVRAAAVDTLWQALGNVLAPFTGGGTVWGLWTDGATTSSSSGVEAGPSMTISSAGTYIIMAWGKASSSSSSTGVRPFLEGSGGLAVSDMLVTVRSQYSASDEIQAYISELGTPPLIGSGSTASAPIFMNGYLVVSTPGTLVVWVASEGTNNVTLSSCYVQLTQIA